MNDYNVEFWYNTDLRTDRKVKAQNEISALVKAMEEEQLLAWCDEAGFSIRINKV